MPHESFWREFAPALAADLVVKFFGSRAQHTHFTPGVPPQGSSAPRTPFLSTEMVDSAMVWVRRVSQTDESAKDALNQCLVHVGKEHKRKLVKLFQAIKQRGDETFHNVARNVDDLTTDKLDSKGAEIAWDKDPRVLFLTELAEMMSDENDVAPALEYLETFDFYHEPKWLDKVKEFKESVKKQAGGSLNTLADWLEARHQQRTGT